MAPELPLDELSAVFARIKGMLLTGEKVDRAVQLLAKAAKESIPGTVGAGVTLIDAQGHKTSSGATDSIVEHADALQYQLGQGPCLTAWATARTVLLNDVGTDGRWPEWSAAVASLPIRSVISTPLLYGAESIGALKVYASTPDAYDVDACRLLELFAGPAATLLANVQGSETAYRISEALETALKSRDTVGRACGVLMERHRLPEEQAMNELLRRARANGKTMLQVCNEIIAGVPASRP